MRNKKQNMPKEKDFRRMTMASSTNNNQPFGIKDKIAYMCGDFGNDFFFILISQFLMVFYTSVLGINAGVVGTLFLVARFVDAFTDIGMGRIVDSAKPGKEGRYRPWIRRIRIPVVLAGVLVFIPWVANLPYALKIVYIFVTYIGKLLLHSNQHPIWFYGFRNHY